MATYDPTNPARAKFVKPTLLPQAIGHATPAVRTLFGLATGAARLVRGVKRRKKRGSRALTAKSVKRRHKKTARKHKTKGLAHMVKGSAAASKHMAALRKMRGAKKAA